MNAITKTETRAIHAAAALEVADPTKNLLLLSLGQLLPRRSKRNARTTPRHRLAPWLGHLMVSRQETARSLLTPGEVMQLPPDEAVVMVSSVAPIKARKLRYYSDANFKRRVLSPPVLVAGRYADAPPARADDWSGLAMPDVPTPIAGFNDDPAASVEEGGPRHQPELSETIAYSPERAPACSDLVLLDDDDLQPVLPRQLDPAMQRVARLASLDPDDGIQL